MISRVFENCVESKNNLKVSKNGVNTRDSDISSRLLVNVSNLTVVDNNGVSSGSDAKAQVGEIEGLANGLGESSVTIGSKDDLVLGTKSLAPSSLDKSVVGRNNNDLVNALSLQLGKLLEVWRNVVLSAGGSESTGDGNNDNLLGGKFLVSIVGSGDTAS